MLTKGRLSDGLYNNELPLDLLLLQIDFFFNFSIDSFGVCL